MLLYLYIINNHILQRDNKMTASTKPLVTDKVLGRIRALLAMGGDTSSEHEAAIATKRANKLMEDYEVSLSDIKDLNGADLGLYKYDLGTGKQKTWLSVLALNIAKLNECIVSFTESDSVTQKASYEFKGFKNDVEICEFMMVYVVDTCKRLYKQDKTKLRLDGALDKEDYLLGLSDKIVIRIKNIIEDRAKILSDLSDGSSLIVQKSALVTQVHGEQKTENTVQEREVNYRAYSGGCMASKEIHLGRFLSDNYKPKRAPNKNISQA